MAKKQQNYKKLKEFWYKKLKRNGFNDIESDEEHLKVWAWNISHTTKYGKNSVQWASSKAEYYHMAAQFLNDHKFETNRERVIWEYHANAISCRDISKLLKKVRVKIDRTSVWRIVKRLENIMKEMYMNGYKKE